MGKQKDTITHPGTIYKIDKDRIHIMILSQSACASCHAKGMCTVADMEEKMIDVANTGEKSYNVGDKVILGMERSLGSRAVLYGYFIPFLVLVGSLIILLAITDNELLSGLIAIGLLVPYYLLLFLSKDKLQKTFEFRIKE